MGVGEGEGAGAGEGAGEGEGEGKEKTLTPTLNMKKHRFSVICSVLFSHTQHSRSILSYKGSIWVNYAGIVRFDVKKSKKMKVNMKNIF